MQTPQDKDIITEDDESDLNGLKATLIRRDLALIVTGLVVAVALIATFQSGALPVLDKILPLVTLAFGFFFGHRASKT